MKTCSGDPGTPGTGPAPAPPLTTLPPPTSGLALQRLRAARELVWRRLSLKLNTLQRGHLKQSKPSPLQPLASTMSLRTPHCLFLTLTPLCGGGRHSSTPPKKTHGLRRTNQAGARVSWDKTPPLPSAFLPARPLYSGPQPCNLPPARSLPLPSSTQEPCGVDGPAEAPGPQHCHRAAPRTRLPGWAGGGMLGRQPPLQVLPKRPA